MANEASEKISPAMERRRRIRQEVIASILDTARAIMREEGVTALNLREVARRVGMRPQSLAEYFPSKADMYDALFGMAIQLMREGDDRALAQHGPDWERVRAWFENRLTFAEDHPELHRLALDMPVPGFVPSDENKRAVRELLESARRGLAEVIEAGVMEPGMSPERAFDILLTARHGIVAERIGKGPVTPERSARFGELIPDVIAVYRAAWEPGRGAQTFGRDGEGAAGG
jgi:AcrR family transcriptional regulator